MISSEIIRGYIDIMVLSVLLDGENYGYEIGKKIREISEERYVIKETTLYSAFTRMERDGMIEPFPGKITHGKPRTYYKITPKGKEYFKKKCDEWYLTKEIINKFVRRGV